MHMHTSGLDSPRQSVGIISHTGSKTSSTKRAGPDDKIKKRSNQVAKELSDMVVYIQVFIINKMFNNRNLFSYRNNSQ